jgi:large subunit ribosomal protein L7/L12
MARALGFIRTVIDPVTVTEEVQEETLFDSFDVILMEIGPKKINAIKVVREQTGLGLKDAKDIVDNVPKTIKVGVSKEDAEKIIEAFKAIDATCIIQKTEATLFDVVLMEIGPKPIKVIKVVQEQTGLGFFDAKKIVDNTPQTIKVGLPKKHAEKIVEAFKAIGATCKIK